VILAGQLMLGATVSCTVMIWTQDAALPLASLVVQVRAMVISCGHRQASSHRRS